jgi:hypothetical protein
VPAVPAAAEVSGSSSSCVNTYCDRYATCNSVIIDHSHDQPTVDMLRVRGWRVWAGMSLTGAALKVTLCDKCVKSTRMQPAEVLEGQMGLFGEQDGQDQAVAGEAGSA